VGDEVTFVQGVRAQQFEHVDLTFFASEAAFTRKHVGLARQAGSAIVDLSKGLACPLGALVLGSRDFIAEARFRKRVLGGGMRQAGVIAACGIVALEELSERLAEDHARARALAVRLAEIPGYAVDVAAVETNMVYADVSALGPSDAVVAALRAEGLLVSDRPPRQVSPDGGRRAEAGWAG